VDSNEIDRVGKRDPDEQADLRDLRVLHEDQGQGQEETPQDKDRVVEKGSLRMGLEELKDGGKLRIVEIPRPYSLYIEPHNHGDRKKEHGRDEERAPFARAMKVPVVQQVDHREKNKLKGILEQHHDYEIHIEKRLKNINHFEGPTKAFKIHLSLLFEGLG
jgi:hypothetical protein